jgi:hypothetical protein
MSQNADHPAPAPESQQPPKAKKEKAPKANKAACELAGLAVPRPLPDSDESFATVAISV